MEIGAVVERVEYIAAVRADAAAGAELIENGLVALREVTAWADAEQAALVRQLASQVSFPEAAIARCSKTSIGQAAKSKDRADTLDRTPNLAGRLGDGAITAGHVDAVTRCSKQLDDRQRSALFDRVDELADVAAAGTVDEFAKRVRLEATRLQADDGLDRLERQKANTRLNTWVDAEGMWNLRGRFDPVAGVKLAATLDRAIETLFAERVPERCPADPIEKQRFLAAHALERLLHGASSGRPGRPEYLVVVDADAPGQVGPVAEWSIPVDIPARVLAELAGDAERDRSRRSQRRRAPRTRRAESRPDHSAREPGTAPGTPRPLQHVCNPGLHRRLRPLRVASHHLVAQRRADGPGEPAPDLFETSRQDPQRWLDHRVGPEPAAHAPPSRWHDPQHRTARPTNGRLTDNGQARDTATSNDLHVGSSRASSYVCCPRRTLSRVRRPEPLPSIDEIRGRLAEHGISHLGVTTSDVLIDARAELFRRARPGLHGDMGFTYRDPERSTDPGRAVEGAQSVIVAARPYLTDADPEHPPA